MTENGKRNDDAADPPPSDCAAQTFSKGKYFLLKWFSCETFSVSVFEIKEQQWSKIEQLWKGRDEKKNVTKYSAKLNKQTKVVPVVSDTQFGSEMAWDSPFAKTRSFWPEL